MKFYSALGLLSLLSCSTAIKLHEGDSINLRHQDEVSDYVNWQVSLLTRVDADKNDEITEKELKTLALAPEAKSLSRSSMTPTMMELSPRPKFKMSYISRWELKFDLCQQINISKSW